LHLGQIQHDQTDALGRAIVQFASDVPAFVILCAQQPAGQFNQLLLRLLAFGDVSRSDYDTLFPTKLD